VVLGAGIFFVAKPGRAKSGSVQQGTVVLQQRHAEAAAGAGQAAVSAMPEAAKLSSTQSFGSLQIANGPMAGNRFVIPKDGLLIGRDSSRCAVVLSLDSVSKEHAWVVPLDNGVAVIDRNSENGTYVNSTDTPRVSKLILKDGDRIFVGRKNPTEITYFAS
jgi:pSer/pThr/pTyr-binding forkhead associated (FHA) protein